MGYPNQWPPAPQPPYRAPDRSRRQTWIFALIASATLFVILVVALIVVVAIRRNSNEVAGGTPPPPAGSAPAAVDTCLIGRWRQTSYRATFDFNDILGSLGRVALSGAGREWTIRADGTGDENFDRAVYEGRSNDGRAVRMEFSGTAKWRVTTTDGRMILLSVSSDVEQSLYVDNTLQRKAPVDPRANPSPYTCDGSGWSATSLTDSSAATRYERIT